MSTFHADSALLELEVRATDGRGRVLDSLPRESFRLFENGGPRPLAGFEYVPEGRRGVSEQVEPQRVHRLLVLFDAGLRFLDGEDERVRGFVDQGDKSKEGEGPVRET